MVAKRPPVPCFNLARTPQALKPWILREDIFNRYTLKQRTLCQRSVYLTVLTLRALLSPTLHGMRWEASDDNGIGTHLYLVNKRDSWSTELAEIVCFNNRELVWGVRVAANPFTGAAKEYNGLDAAEGLRYLLVNTARFAQKLQMREVRLPIVGGSNPDELRKLIQASGQYRGGASFISDKTIAAHYR